MLWFDYELAFCLLLSFFTTFPSHNDSFFHFLMTTLVLSFLFCHVHLFNREMVLLCLQKKKYETRAPNNINNRINTNKKAFSAAKILLQSEE